MSAVLGYVFGIVERMYERQQGIENYVLDKNYAALFFCFMAFIDVTPIENLSVNDLVFEAQYANAFVHLRFVGILTEKKNAKLCK